MIKHRVLFFPILIAIWLSGCTSNQSTTDTETAAVLGSFKAVCEDTYGYLPDPAISSCLQAFHAQYRIQKALGISPTSSTGSTRTSEDTEAYDTVLSKGGSNRGKKLYRRSECIGAVVNGTLRILANPIIHSG